MAKSELSVLSRQCLSHRILDKKSLTKEIAVWQIVRNSKHATAECHFGTANAGVKLGVWSRSVVVQTHR